ncbi:MAG: helix-turn-helix transcriptional regulator [Erysipelotrichaceae bacterium]|nr:helix-turn-helix transcriptional regulator [Erysipelotrichaceae bacterium]
MDKLMRTWNDYKKYVKNIDSASKDEMENIETMASIISSLIEQRNALGISQRRLAELCNMPQASIARIESYKSTPSLDTLLKIMKPLGLTLTVSVIDRV